MTGVSLLYSEAELRSRVQEVGSAIARDYAGRDPVLVSLLKGGTMFLADLIRATRISLSLDFMSISPYGEASGGPRVVRIMKDLEQDVVDRHVIVVEDIVDTGLTLSYLLSSLEARGTSSVAVCALLDKSVRRITPVDLAYVGFDCPDRFVIGYGLDLGQRYRNLPYIAAVDDPDVLAGDPLAIASLLDEPPPR